MSKRADAFIEVGLLGGSLGTLKKNCSFTCQRRTYVPCLLKMGIIILGSYTTSESRPNCLQQQTTEESRRSNNFYSSTQVFVYFSIWKIQSARRVFIDRALDSFLRVTERRVLLLYGSTIESVASYTTQWKLLALPKLRVENFYRWPWGCLWSLIWPGSEAAAQL